MCIKISVGNEKCVELLIIVNIWMEFHDRDLVLKLFFDRCNDAVSVNSALSQTNIMMLERYDILDMCCNVCE